MKKFNIKVILQLMGILLLFNGGFMLISALVSLYYDDGALEGILLAGIVTLTLGLILRFVTKGFKKSIKKREGYLVVSLGWITMSLSGALPYMFSGAIPSFTDAFFETMSGYTTTGASILQDIEIIPRSVLF